MVLYYILHCIGQTDMMRAGGEWCGWAKSSVTCVLMAEAQLHRRHCLLSVWPVGAVQHFINITLFFMSVHLFFIWGGVPPMCGPPLSSMHLSSCYPHCVAITAGG